MKRNRTTQLLLVLATWAFAYCCLAEAITGFTALKVSGRCMVHDAGRRQPIELNREYPFGTMIETERKSAVDLQFSDGNTFRLLARTRLKITEDTRNPKLKILNLETGSVELKLDRFPDDHKLQVETPTAVCGAVGTRFVVSFEFDENEPAAQAKAASRETVFGCDQGEVFVASRFNVGNREVTGSSFNVPSLSAGGQMVATIHEGLENTYTDITVNRGRLTFEYGGERGGNSFQVEPQEGGMPSRFVAALEKSRGSVDAAAITVVEGKVKSAKRFEPGQDVTELDASDGAVIVKDNKIYKESNTKLAQAYVEATKVEGELHSQLVVAQEMGQPTQQLETRVEAAADKATKLRRQLFARRTIRAMQLLRRAGNPARNVPNLPRGPRR